jgi:hypothetical protein
MIVMNLIKNNEEGEGGGEQGGFMQEDGSLNNAPDSKFGSQTSRSQEGNQGKKKVQPAAANVISMEKEAFHRDCLEIKVQKDESDPLSDGELMNSSEEDARGGELVSPEAEQLRDLATIPEVESPSHKSKRRAQSGDEHSLVRATRMKVARNLDFSNEKGNSSTTHASFIHFQMSK